MYTDAGQVRFVLSEAYSKSGKRDSQEESKVVFQHQQERGEAMSKTELVKRQTLELLAAERKVQDAEQNFTEDFYLLGQAYDELKGGETWKQLDCETWNQYCKLERLGHSRTHICRLINAYEMRPSLTDVPNGTTWTEGQVRELQKVYTAKGGGAKGVKRVSRKIVAALKGKNAPVLTAALVKKYVDADLGTKKKTNVPADTTPDPEMDVLAAFRKVVEIQFDLLEGWNTNQWRLLNKQDPGAAQDFARFLRGYAKYITS